jgi:hypothetical protein
VRRLAPVCLALAAALLGCSSGSGSGEGGGPATAAKSPTTSGSSAGERQIAYANRLPMAWYSYSVDDNTVIESAQHVLTRRCLKTYGIQYEPPQQPLDAPRSADRRYGLSSATEAALYGYHPNRDIAQLPDGPDLPKDALTVFYGKRGAPQEGGGEKLTYKGKAVPDDGCFGQSVAKLSQEYDDPAGAAIASRIANESYEESLADPAVKEAFRKWSACMRSSGFRYSSPMEPLNNPAFQGNDISAKEKQTATADVRCKKETRLLDIWFKAETGIQKAEIEKNYVALEKLRAAHREKAEAARRIVAEG